MWCALVLKTAQHQERRGGSRAGAGRKPQISYDAKTLLAKDFKSLAQDVSLGDLPGPQPWHLLQSARQAYEKADKKFAAAVLHAKQAKAHLRNVASDAADAQHALSQCLSRLAELEELYNRDPVCHLEEFLKIDKLQTDKQRLETKLIALAEQVAIAEDQVTLLLLLSVLKCLHTFVLCLTSTA